MTGDRPEDSSEVAARLQPWTVYELSTTAGRGLDPADLVKLVAEQAGKELPS